MQFRCFKTQVNVRRFFSICSTSWLNIVDQVELVDRLCLNNFPTGDLDDRPFLVFSSRVPALSGRMPAPALYEPSAGSFILPNRIVAIPLGSSSFCCGRSSFKSFFKNFFSKSL